MFYNNMYLIKIKDIRINLSIIALILLSSSCKNLNTKSNQVHERSISNAGQLKIDTTWHHNGNIATISTYSDSLLHGNYQEYFPSGLIQVEKTYHQGKLKTEKLYTQESKVIKNIIIKNGRTYGLLRSSFCINGMVKNPENNSYQIRKDDQ